MHKVYTVIRKNCPLPALCLILAAVAAGIVHLGCVLSVSFADFMNVHVSWIVRAVLAKATNLFPFSVAEILLILLPVILVILIVLTVKKGRSEDETVLRRYTCSLLGVCSLLYSIFVFGFASGYYASGLDRKLDLMERAVSAEELYRTAEVLRAQCEEEAQTISFRYGSFSVMPYSLDEMNTKLNDAYEKAADKYSFLRSFRSNLKYVLLSEPMSYTHITGVYTYFTGEANINVNFPDYTIPYTAAHELSHQRGIAREEEANFMAYLVCMESDDAYIRYSAAFNLLEYVMNALYSADRTLYGKMWSSLDSRFQYEMIAYNEFFEKYRENKVADVSEKVNDTYLKSQGQTQGSRSYGCVVDLAVLYLCGSGE